MDKCVTNSSPQKLLDIYQNRLSSAFLEKMVIIIIIIIIGTAMMLILFR